MEQADIKKKERSLTENRRGGKRVSLRRMSYAQTTKEGRHLGVWKRLCKGGRVFPGTSRWGKKNGTLESSMRRTFNLDKTGLRRGRNRLGTKPPACRRAVPEGELACPGEGGRGAGQNEWWKGKRGIVVVHGEDGRGVPTSRPILLTNNKGGGGIGERKGYVGGHSHSTRRGTKGTITHPKKRRRNAS